MHAGLVLLYAVLTVSGNGYLGAGPEFPLYPAAMFGQALLDTYGPVGSMTYTAYKLRRRSHLIADQA